MVLRLLVSLTAVITLCTSAVCCTKDLDFYKPKGPAYHLDLYQMGLGAPALHACTGWFMLSGCQRFLQASQPLHAEAGRAVRSCVAPTVSLLPADCLPWCTTEDGVHVTSTVNEVLLQQLANMFAIRQAWPVAQQLVGPAAA